MIVGIDEVGRGPWAGPLVVGAVILGDTKIKGLTDSKKLSKKSREELSLQILQEAESCGLGWVDANEIDAIGISAALTLATKRALEQITVPYHQIIVDGTVNFLKNTGKGPYVTTMKKADLLIGAVSAASIIAKVARDDYMAEQDNIYEGYGFVNHVGYGTAKHRKAIEVFGITPLHRRSFAPIATMLDSNVPEQKAAIITNKQTGNDAETVVATWLEAEGYHLVARNWRTRFCEIDIIATKQDKLHFIEVKYRKQANQGGGIAAITPLKLRQMHFAAEVYIKYNSLYDMDAALCAVAAHGMPVVVEELVEIS